MNEEKVSCPLSYNTANSKIKEFTDFHSPYLMTILFLLTIVIYTQNLPAQTYAMRSELDTRLKSALDSTPVIDTTGSDTTSFADSFPPPPKPKLLPDNISFGEKLFWGEKGVFRSMGIVPQLSPEERKNELGIRRFMLTTHQITGFTTVALMLTTVYFGQKTIDNHMNRTYSNDHQMFVDATIATYSLTALLAILSPPPLIRRDNEESTTTLHKTLAWIHAAGMILTPILGSMIGGRRSFNMDKAHFHQVAGYLTVAVFTASFIVITI
jgi:hypothetical protein